MENSTYIGLKSLILDNVKVKSGSRIIPNSTVTKNILKKNSIVFGTPSKVIGYDNKI